MGTPRDTTIEPLLVSIKQAAALLNISPETARLMVVAGDLPHVRLGRRRLIPRDEIDRFIRTRLAS